MPASGKDSTVEGEISRYQVVCSTPLVFKQLWGPPTWYLQCKGCGGGFPQADKHFPKVVLDIVEQHHTGGQFALKDLLRLLGLCR